MLFIRKIATARYKTEKSWSFTAVSGAVFEYPMIKFAVVAESDIFGEEKKKRRKKKLYEGQKIHSFTDLNIGDYVVHENHGLGIYKGIEKVEVDHIEKDYIKIEYEGGGNLYVLATQLDMIQKYAWRSGEKTET